MPLAQQAKKEIFESHGTHDSDVGSTPVQVALMSRRISDLTEHLKTHKHDFASRRGMFKLVSRRRALLRYLRGRNPQQYRELVNSLGLRG